MVNRFDYKIFKSVFSGDGGDEDFIGGQVSDLQLDSFFPENISTSAKGDGARWIYRKYWLAITNTSFSDGPVLSDILIENLTATGATVTWSTDTSGDSNALWDLDSNNLNSETGATGLVTSHSLDMVDLEDGRTYFYKVFSDDILGNRGSTDRRTFFTPDITPPIFTLLEARLFGLSGAKIRFNANENTTGYVRYGRDTDYNEGTGNDLNISKVHGVVFEGLETGTWLFETQIEDLAGNNATSGELSLFIPSTGGDDNGPVISDFNIGDTGSFTFIAGWNTDVPSQTKIVWGTGEDDYQNQFRTPQLILTHNVTIQGVEDETEFFTRPVAIGGNDIVTSGDEVSFITHDGTEPEFTGIAVTTGQTTAVIDFHTTEDATGYVEYGTRPDVFNQAMLVTPSTLATNIRATTAGGTGPLLVANTTYYAHFVFDDANTNTGEILNFAFTTNEAPDTDPPVISNLIASPTETDASITWITDENADTKVFYSLLSGDREYGSESSAIFEIAHIMGLTGLVGDTDYFYSVESLDISSNIGESETGLFHTNDPAGGDPDIQISNVQAINITDVGATITWDTNILGDSEVGYGIGDSSLNTESSNVDVLSHIIPLSNLTPNSTYNYFCRSTSATDDLDTDTTVDFSFTTDPAVDTDLNDGDELGIIEVVYPNATAFPNNQMPLHVVVPLVENNDLNINWEIDDNVVQREIVKRKANGDITHVEIIVLVNLPIPGSPGDIINYSLKATNSPLGAGFTEPDYTSTSMTLTMPGGNSVDNHTSTIIGGNPRIYKNGHVCKTIKYYNRLVDSNGRKTLGIHSYVTYYNGFPISTVHMNMENCHIDPTMPLPSQGEHGFHYDIVGKIFFDELFLDTNQDNNAFWINNRHDRYCTSKINNRSIRYIGYGQPGNADNRSVQGVRSEIWPAGYARAEHFSILDPPVLTYEALAKEMCDYQNVGHLISGRNDGNKIRSWGPGLFRVGRFTDDYVSDSAGGPIGRARSNDKYGKGAQTMKENLANNATNGNAEGYIQGNNVIAKTMGCWHPVSLPNKGSDGGIYLLGPFDGMDLVPENLRHWTYFADTVRERHHYQMYANDGNVIGVEDWKAAHAGLLPFHSLSTTGTSGRRIQPFSQTLNAVGDEGVTKSRFVWSQLFNYNGGTCAYNIEGFNFWASFTPIDDAHIQRLFRCYQGLIDSYNDPMNKDLLRTQAEYFLMCYDNDTNFDAEFGYVFQGTIKDRLDILQDISHRFHGINWHGHWGRGAAWAHYTMALFYTYAMEQTGNHANLVQSEDLITATTQRWRAATLDHFIDYYLVMIRAMPGGRGITTPTHRRIIDAQTPATSAFGSQNQDIGSVQYALSEVESDFTVSTNNGLPQSELIQHPEIGTAIGDLTVYRPLLTDDGLVFVYKEDKQFIPGGRVIDDTTGLGRIHSQTSSPEWRRDPLEWHGFTQLMEMNINCLSMFSVATAVFDGVFKNRRDNLYIYVYEYVKKQVDETDHIYQALIGGEGPAGGYSDGLFASSDISPQGSNVFWDHTLHNDYLTQPQKAPYKKELFPRSQMFHTWYPQVCALYAGEVLGLETSTTEHPFLLEARRIYLNPFATTYADKIATCFNKAGRASNTNAWDMTYMWAAWLGEFQYQNSLIPEATDGDVPSVSNIKIGLRSKHGPGQILFAVTKENFGSAIDQVYGTTDGDQNIVQFYKNLEDAGGGNTGDGPPPTGDAGGDDGSDENFGGITTGEKINRPEFGIRLGQSNFLTLPGENGNIGGKIVIHDSNTHVVPFWVAIRLEENEAPGDVNIEFGVEADEG